MKSSKKTPKRGDAPPDSQVQKEHRGPHDMKKLRELHQEKYGKKGEDGKSPFYKRWGQMGWDKVKEKYGPDAHEFLYIAARQHRLDHPSGPEQAMMNILDEMGIEYTREKRVISIMGSATLFSMDFYLNATHQAIEVNSGVHDIDEKRSARQWADKQRLLKGVQIPVLLVYTGHLECGLAPSMVYDFVQEGLDTMDERLAKYKGLKQEIEGNTREAIEKKKRPGFGY